MQSKNQLIADGLGLTLIQPKEWNTDMNHSLLALNRAQEPPLHWCFAQLPNLKCVQKLYEESNASFNLHHVGLD